MDCFSPYRHRTALTAFAQHMHLCRLHVHPAARRGCRHGIQTHQLCDTQTAAVKQFHHRRITRFKPWVLRFILVAGELHRVIHTQRFGQRFGGFGRFHVLHRVAGNQPFAPQPDVKASPTRQNQRNAAPAATARVHLRHPAANVTGLHLEQFDRD